MVYQENCVLNERNSSVNMVCVSGVRSPLPTSPCLSCLPPGWGACPHKKRRLVVCAQRKITKGSCSVKNPGVPPRACVWLRVFGRPKGKQQQYEYAAWCVCMM